MLLLELVVEREVGEVGGVAPAGGVIHAGGSEGTVNAELVLAGLDVIGASLQLVEGVDVLGLVAGLLEELLVVDDACLLYTSFAGKLIMDAGLRGHAVGGAQVSEKHCGFIVNADHATAADVDELIRDIQAKVKEQFGVDLEPEVHRVGEFL